VDGIRASGLRALASPVAGTAVTVGEPPLVGRAAEVEVLEEVLDALGSDGVASVLQVAGDAGIGKSRLLHELRASSRARGYVVLSGRAAEFEAELPFGVFSHALDDWLISLDRKRLRALAGGLSAQLAVVLLAFEQLAPVRTPEIPQERNRAYRAVRSLLSSIADDTPLVLVLDDVHWADPGSVELLCHLLAHPPRGAVLLAVGYRPAQVPARLTSALALALHEAEGRRLDLAPLIAASARELLGAGPSRAVADRLQHESGGNPFFLLQLARATTRGRALPTSDGAGVTVPQAVREALETELSSLSAPALTFLKGAAVTGDPFEALLAASAAEIAEADARDPVDELLESHLLHPAAQAGEYAFRHPIVRATVSELTSVGWRVGAHARLADVLAGRGAPSTARAPHIERSAAPGDTSAVEVLVDAGRLSAPRAPTLAARWYGAALRILPGGAETKPLRIELLIAKATALGLAGQLEESRSALVELLGTLPSSHPARVSVIAFCAGVEHLLGRHRAAHERLVGALGELADDTSLEAGQLAAELAAGAGFENRYDEMMRWAERALELATRLGERALAVVAAGQIALARYFLGLPSGDAMDLAAAALDDLDDDELAARLDIGLWVGWSEAVLERNQRAIEHCERVIAVSRATGQGATLLVTMTAQAWSLIRLGRLADAEEVLTVAVEAGRLAPNLFLSVAVGLTSVVATHKGAYLDAVRAGEESVRLARSADPGLIQGMSGLYNAIPLIEMGEAERARAILLATNGGGPDLQTSRSGYAVAYELLTRAELMLGNQPAAEEWARRAAAAAGDGDLVAEATAAQRARAAVALSGKDAAAAAQMMLEAAARADGAGAPVEASRCRILAARSLLRLRQRRRAVAELNRAVETLAAVGADGYRADAEQELQRLVRRTATATGQAGEVGDQREPETLWPELTHSERAVVELVAQGLSNPEVAQRLYVSRHTVKTHLTNAMLKLGVNSRVRLTNEVARRKR
jgi:DNA-binding CsgD family transcriptional regulator/tetratricopeptide (TPR) repeat protein